MSHYPIENKVVNEVETNSSFTCKDESKSFGTKIVGIHASKRIISILVSILHRNNLFLF